MYFSLTTYMLDSIQALTCIFVPKLLKSIYIDQTNKSKKVI